MRNSDTRKNLALSIHYVDMKKPMVGPSHTIITLFYKIIFVYDFTVNLFLIVTCSHKNPKMLLATCVGRDFRWTSTAKVHICNVGSTLRVLFFDCARREKFSFVDLKATMVLCKRVCLIGVVIDVKPRHCFTMCVGYFVLVVRPYI